MLLEHVKNIEFIDEELENEIAELSESITQILDQLNEELGMQPNNPEMSMPRPGMGDETLRDQPAEETDVVAAMDTIVKQMDAAKRGMAILNKMADSSSRTRNRSRVMGNLNKIRGSLQRVTNMLGK